MTSAKRGDSFMLAGLAACYSLICSQLEIQNSLVLAREWKGNMSHDIVERRVLQKTNYEGNMSDHIIDAIGIGLHAFGRFNEGRKVCEKKKFRSA
jgi:hypothetical protein